MFNARLHLDVRNLMLAAAGIAIAWFAFIPGGSSASGKPSPEPAETAQAPGRLIIVRSPNIGPQIVGLEIDGVQTARISYNRRYDAPLAAGAHVLTIYPVIGGGTSSMQERRLTVEPGKTYLFTASWQHTGIFLN
jgi:hypothetical protein